MAVARSARLATSCRVPVLPWQLPWAAVPCISYWSVPVWPPIASELKKTGSVYIWLSTATTCRGLVESARESPEPSTSWGAMPNLLASSARTTAAPAAVVPAPPKRAPSPFSSISAR
jgi:hypothetical protein